MSREAVAVKHPAEYLVCCLLACGALAAGCTSRPRPAAEAPALRFEQGSQAIWMPVDPEGFVHLSDYPPLLGLLDVSPILRAEGATPESVHVMLNQGRLYLVADGFASLWEVQPAPDPSASIYRGFPIPPGAAGVRLSRYGPRGRACVRLDSEGAGPLFLTREGALHESCP